MADLSNIFTNPVLQAFVFSPLMGVLFAILFSGMTKTSVPVTRTVRETRHVYVEKHYHRQSSRSSSDGRGEIALTGIALVFIVWQYAVHAQVIQQILITVVTTALYFALISGMIAYWKGHLTSSGWIISLTMPACILAAGLILALRAKAGFSDVITEKAMEYQFLQFYISGLSEYGRYYMITHVLGVVFLFLLSIVSIFSLLHYLSLMNQRDDSVGFEGWDFAIRISGWAAGGKGTAVALILLVASGLLLEGYVTGWIYY